MSVIGLVETDVLSALDKAAGRKVRTIQSLPGDWDDDTLKRMLTMVPCLLLAFAGGAPRVVGETIAAIDGQWIVYVATGNASGDAARRLGDAQQVGAYELLEAVVVPALHGHLVPGVGSLDLTRIENLFTGTVERQGIAVYAATFQIPMQFDPVPDPDALGDFTTFDAQYDVPPIDTDAAHMAWLVGNLSTSKPDAHDTVAVPQT